jgi:Holliday junction resolvase
MKDENRERKGNSLENEIGDMFKRIGFKTDIRSKKFGFESDVIATRGDFIILIQAKRYDDTQVDIDSLIEEWKEKGDRVGADRVLLIITGHKNINDNHIRKAKQKEVYLWNENYWRKLQDLDSVNLSLQVGKSLKIEEILDYIMKKEQKKLKYIKEKIENIKNSKLKDEIYAELEKINFSEDTKLGIQLKKIENKIILFKEKEIEAQNKGQIENEDVNELVLLTKKLDFNRKIDGLEKISQLDFSPENKKIAEIEKLKEKLRKANSEAELEYWWDEKLDSLEEMRKEGKISPKTYLEFKEKAKEIGASKTGISNAEKKGFEYGLEKAKSIDERKKFFQEMKKKLIKIAISLGILAITFIILWRVLF